MIVNLILVVTAVTWILVWLSLSPLRQRYADHDPSDRRTKKQRNDHELAFGVWFAGVVGFVMWIGIGLFLTFLLSVDFYVFGSLERFLIELFTVLSAPFFALYVGHEEEVQAPWVAEVAHVTERVLPICLALIGLLGVYGSLGWYDGGIVPYAQEMYGFAFEVLYVLLVVAMLALVVFSSYRVWKLLSEDSKADAELVGQGRVHDSGCWMCGSAENQTFESEYGWYGEQVADYSTATFTHKTTEKHYARIGTTSVALCDSCVSARLRHLRATAAPTVNYALCAAFFTFLPGAFLLDWFTGLGLSENSIDFLYKSDKPTVPAILLAIITFVALVATAILGVLALMHISSRGEKATSEATARTADELAWDVAKGAIEREYEEFDPHYLFYPNAPSVTYRTFRVDGVLCKYAKHERAEVIEGGGWVTTRYWIAPRESFVDAWETNAVEPRREVYSYTESTEQRPES